MFSSVGHFGIGKRNGDLAKQLLQSQGIPVVAECLYGDGYRKVVFDADTGKVLSHQVANEIQAVPSPRPLAMAA